MKQKSIILKGKILTPMVKKTIIRKGLTKQNFRNIIFRFFNHTKFEYNNIWISVKLNLFKKVNKKPFKDNLNLETQILDVTNKIEVRSYIDAVTTEIILANKKVKPKDIIIITYLYVDLEVYKKYKRGNS